MCIACSFISKCVPVMEDDPVKCVNSILYKITSFRYFALKQRILAFLVLGLILLLPLRASAGALEDYTEARKMFLATAASMAAYSNRPVSLGTESFA